MRAATIIALLLTLTVAGACSKTETQSTTVADKPAQSITLTPEQLGELGAAMSHTPERANDLLEQHGLTRESYEKAIRDLTEDPAASRRYAVAYKKASV